MPDLFTPITRDDRQKQCIKSWLKHNGLGTIVACTGFGKTRTAIKAIQLLLSKYPTYSATVIVPTDVLKEQWQQLLDKEGLAFSCNVQVINSAIKHEHNTDILVLDEAHRYNSDLFSQIFQKIKYKYILGLTATFERLDGKEKIMAHYCPVVDTITIEEALLNKWVSDYTEYEVIIDVPDINEYKALNKEFISHFEFFNFDYSLAMSMLGADGYKARLRYRDSICPNGSKADRDNILKAVTIHSMGFMRCIQARKKFINNHPKKLEIARKIIEARKNKKIITFSNNVKMAESIGMGDVYTGKVSKKKGRTTIEEFNKRETGLLNTVKKADEGIDVSGLSVAIVLGLDSAKTKAVQRRGRAIRYAEGKKAEIFNIIINHTTELKWFENSHVGSNYITVDEYNLDKILKGEDFDTYQKPIEKIAFRY